MSRKKQSDEWVQLSARVPTAIYEAFQRVHDSSMARELKLAMMLWTALPTDAQILIRGQGDAAGLEQAIQRVADRLAGPPPASEVVDAVEVRQRGRKRTARRNTA